MGGSAFSSDHAHVEDPNAFQLDLSSWEASLRPLSTGSTSPWGTNIFSSLFTPTEMTFACLPGFCAQPSGNGCFPESLQVVPLCFPTPAGSMDSQQNSDVVLVTAAVTDNGAAPGDAIQGSPVEEDSRMSLQFSDHDRSAPCGSPSSSEAGIVPDFDAPHGSPRKSSGCTATSGSLSQVDSGLQGPTTLATTMQLLPTHLHAPLSPLTSLNFVPVGGGSTTASGRSQEPTNVTLGPLQHSEPAAFSCATSANAPVPAACGTMAAVTAPAERRDSATQNSVQQPQACLAFSAAAAASVETCHPQAPYEPQPLHYQQQQQAGYVRTRAECLKRYREKKARRLYTKTIRYQLRKINADKRPRIKGRFVKKEESEEFLSASRMMPTDGTVIQGAELEDPYFGNQCLLYSDDD